MMIVIFLAYNFQSLGAQEIKNDEKDIKAILKTVSPSVVKVIFENQKRNFSSGIAIDRNYVVSSIMISRYPFDSIYVQTVDGKSYPAKLVGKDEASRLILLKINESVLTPFASTVKNRHIEVGDWTALVGAFYHQFPSIFQGMISSASEDELLLNAPVVPGSPGGAVVDKRGQLLGIIIGPFGFAFSPDYTFKDASGEIHIQGVKSKQSGLCYAVPITKVVGIADELKRYGKVRRGWLGVQVMFGSNRVSVTDVVEHSPADRADIRKNDEILQVNGKDIHKPGDFIEMARNLKPDQKIKLEFLRGNQKRSAVVVVGEARNRALEGSDVDPMASIPDIMDFPDSLPRMEDYVIRITGSRNFGFEAMELTPELSKEFNVKNGTGLMVSKVYANTPAEKAGFKVSDIIVRINDKAVHGYADLVKTANDTQDNAALNVDIYRKGKMERLKVVPDKDVRINRIFESFSNKIENIKRRVTEKKIQKSPDPQQKELDKYKAEIERMRKEQERMREKLDELMKRMEEKNKEEKNETTA